MSQEIESLTILYKSHYFSRELVFFNFSLKIYRIKHCTEYCRYKNGEIFTFNNHFP